MQKHAQVQRSNVENVLSSFVTLEFRPAYFLSHCCSVCCISLLLMFSCSPLFLLAVDVDGVVGFFFLSVFPGDFSPFRPCLHSNTFHSSRSASCCLHMKTFVFYHEKEKKKNEKTRQGSSSSLHS